MYCMWRAKTVNSGAAVDVFSEVKYWISHLKYWSLQEGKQWEIGKGRWIISSGWIIIYCGVHSTVLCSPPGLNSTPSLPKKQTHLRRTNLQLVMCYRKHWCHHDNIVNNLSFLNQAIWGWKTPWSPYSYCDHLHEGQRHRENITEDNKSGSE